MQNNKSDLIVLFIIYLFQHLKQLLSTVSILLGRKEEAGGSLITKISPGRNIKVILTSKLIKNKENIKLVTTNEAISGQI